MNKDLMEANGKFMKELKENGGGLGYDFTRENHRAVFFGQYGGEELFHRELPLLYEALQYGGAAQVPLREGNYLLGPSDCMEVSNINHDPQKNTSTLISGKYTKEKIGIDLMGKFWDVTTGTILESMAIWDEDTADISNTMSLSSKGLMDTDDLQLQTQAEFFWTDINADNRLCASSQKVCSDIMKVTGTKYFIKSVNVISPMPKVTEHTYTELLYDRDPDDGETADYNKFSGVRHEVDQKVYVNIHVPAKIEITLNDGFEFLVNESDVIKGVYFKDFEMKIWSLKNGTVVFNKDDLGKDVVVTYDAAVPTKIAYEFPTNWDHLMELKVVEAKMYADFSCTLPIQCKHGITEHKDGQVVIVVTSDLRTTSEDPANKEIKKLHIKFGCLGKETQILMADGSKRAISSIKVGDQVRSAEGGCAKVKNIYSGMEKEMVSIETMEGKKILLTESHPIKVKRDGRIIFVRGDKVNGADVLQTQDGEEPLRYIYMKTYNDKVYNLELESAESFYANGFIVGDFEIQNSAFAQESKEKPCYPIDVEPVKAEMKRLLELYKQYAL